MSADQLNEAVFGLPERERFELSRRIVESVDAERRVISGVEEGVRRIEEVVTDRVKGHSDEEFRRAVG